ncbi:MLYCD [Branchiostoma lanceolatum]|uniref:MLYCD protein n=1 Tax=Branchiostoma lanceolatum TaxID=7740 RepID=A0A8J9YHX0_BRALA|nr:MLYCD [Branchiostoma lanceolatum]
MLKGSLHWQRLKIYAHNISGLQNSVDGAESGVSSPSLFTATISQMVTEIIGPKEAGLKKPTIPEGKTRHLCDVYGSLSTEDKATFLRVVSRQFGTDHDEVLKAAEGLPQAKEKSEAALLKAEERLQAALVPRYHDLFVQIGRLEGGVKHLVDMRADTLDLLSTVKDNAELRSFSSCLREMLSHWFSAGLLHLQRITWESSCDILQKISEYEAVHPMKNWSDLKRRVGPYRRCFIFTHSTMPREPMVVLHTALTNQISDNIQTIVSTPILDDEDVEDINTAIFYSITSTQKGLQGVELGNYLIKRVVRELQAEFPKMTQFSSLSPIPGFRDWLVGEINKVLSSTALLTSAELKKVAEIAGKEDVLPLVTLKKLLQTNQWMGAESMVETLKDPLMRLCARYLYLEKRRGYAVNPVANFHLRNGAVLWRLNWQADTNPRGISQSCGIMVNYRYFLGDTMRNSQRYMEEQHIEASQQVIDLAQAAGGVDSPAGKSNL